MGMPITQGFREQNDDRPTWRGWIHAGVLPIVVAAGIVLVALANGAAAKATTAIFFASSVLLFGNSALYHRFNWSPKVKKTLKRIDHANIFLLIAGSYTPITWLALPREKALVLMIAIWAIALLGIGFRVFWISAPRWLYVPIYISMGWAAIVFMGDFFAANTAMMILILSGGLAYTLGAIVYGFKRPNPWPGKFGFHEIFHSFTVLAFMSHWAGILLIALQPAAGSYGA
ncbi:MAG: hemolysin III family protein [Micrococcales bacterium]